MYSSYFIILEHGPSISGSQLPMITHSNQVRLTTLMCRSCIHTTHHCPPHDTLKTKKMLDITFENQNTCSSFSVSRDPTDIILILIFIKIICYDIYRFLQLSNRIQTSYSKFDITKDLYAFSSILENVNLDLLLLIRSVFFFSCLVGSDGVVVDVNCGVRVLLFCCCW